MFLCLITASTIRKEFVRGEETLIYFPVSLSERLYKVDITCAALAKKGSLDLFSHTW